MKFTFEPRRTRRDPSAERPTFRVARIWSDMSGRRSEISHLIDRTYDYASERELRWHLAERFARPVGSLTLERL
ncbi:MAG TPA: hypothetical protein VEA41_12640 [Salinarimonas sp.]|jgi:hypothetical protein|nr:hypothetical protein [Salinarimonas sp.]